MIFGEVGVDEAVGALAAHSVKAGGYTLKKGAIVGPDDAERLRAAGISRIVAARLGPDDMGEDEAAGLLAHRIGGASVRVEQAVTGRCNLFAEHDGILAVAASRVHGLNALDEAVTLATLPAYKPVVAGEMVATVKIIPYSVERNVFDRASILVGDEPLVAVHRFALKRIGMISTLTPGFKPTVVTKTARVFAERLAPMGASIAAEADCPHEPSALAKTLRRQIDAVEMIVVFGASAIADRRDVIPAAIDAAGGRLIHLGMPVDPGNLLLLGEIDGKPVLGAPGCARSPKENGFDWVLGRLVAGLPVTKQDITRMGVGGLLMEIVSRGQPRDGGDRLEDDP
jgi:molybdenum cofactor cytidylyltransferase